LRARIAPCKTARVQPSHDAIRAQLERIAASPQFAGSARMGRFLRFVVERSLAGEGERLKEYVIGTEVFDRGTDYDPRMDSIVRVEAGRLRTKLEEYYRNGGSGDAVRIGLSKGSYAPFFEEQLVTVPAGAVPAKPGRAVAGAVLAGVVALLVAIAVLWDLGRGSGAASSNPVIAVLPFVPYDADEDAIALGERLTEGIAAEFVRDGRLAVVPSARSLRFRDPRAIPDDIGQQLGAQFLLRGRAVLEADGQLRVEAVLMDGKLTRKPWGNTYSGTLGDLDEIERRIAQEAAGAAVARMAAPVD
jgi:TolB-like protein